MKKWYEFNRYARLRLELFMVFLCVLRLAISDTVLFSSVAIVGWFMWLGTQYFTQVECGHAEHTQEGRE